MYVFVGWKGTEGGGAAWDWLRAGVDCRVALAVAFLVSSTCAVLVCTPLPECNLNANANAYYAGRGCRAGKQGKGENQEPHTVLCYASHIKWIRSILGALGWYGRMSTTAAEPYRQLSPGWP